MVRTKLLRGNKAAWFWGKRQRLPSPCLASPHTLFPKALEPEPHARRPNAPQLNTGKVVCSRRLPWPSPLPLPRSHAPLGPEPHEGRRNPRLGLGALHGARKG